jgi:beta-N-acetylhexosaminidase
VRKSTWLGAGCLAASLFLLAACRAGGTSADSGIVAHPSPKIDVIQQTFGNMTDAQRVGQLFMSDVPSTGAGATAASRTAYQKAVGALTANHVGSVILDGNDTLGHNQVTAQLHQIVGEPAPLIATDEEGDLVQRLKGPGFDPIPSALVQGAEPPAALRTDAAHWASELKTAGVNVDLAPVMDTVPAGFGSNPPIGDLGREYGRTPQSVSDHGVAVAQGLRDAKVIPTFKHFPGLGRVHGNTDKTPTTDVLTTRHDAYLAPFAAGLKAGSSVVADAPAIPSFVMVSLATYRQIDPAQPAAFSRTIITGMLRGDLGFHGVIVSDDLGNAKAVATVPVGERATRFIAAGGTMILTVNPDTVAPMARAVLDKMAADPAFKQQVYAATHTVLTAKHQAGLL